MQAGNGNSYPMAQCTWWACQYYYTLTGIYPGKWGNAYQWIDGAYADGWQVNNVPPTNIPSIICLQGSAGQGVNSVYGHVAVVTKVLSDGTIQTSDMNWCTGPILMEIPNTTGLSDDCGNTNPIPVRQVDFHAGYGVSFIYASNQAVTTASSSGQGGALLTAALSAVKSISLAPNASVTQFLYASDAFLAIDNPFNPPNVSQITIGPVSFEDPISYIANVFGTIFQDIKAILLRIVLFFLGLATLKRVLSYFVDYSTFKRPY
jgi:surface antigen